jgi:hypothetical protein
MNDGSDDGRTNERTMTEHRRIDGYRQRETTKIFDDLTPRVRKCACCARAVACGAWRRSAQVEVQLRPRARLFSATRGRTRARRVAGVLRLATKGAQEKRGRQPASCPRLQGARVSRFELRRHAAAPQCARGRRG